MIRNDRPPNYDAIVAAFPHASRPGVVFAYGEFIFNPTGSRLPREILEHEYKHCGRQFIYGAEHWWGMYLTDSEFRYAEELYGHAAELKARLRVIRDRNARYKALTLVAHRLVAPLYNYQPPRSFKQAMADLSANI